MTISIKILLLKVWEILKETKFQFSSTKFLVLIEKKIKNKKRSYMKLLSYNLR